MGFAISLLVFGLIIAAVISGVGRALRGSSEDRDAAASVRRLFVYLLLLAALGVLASGVQALLEIVLDTERAIAGRGSGRQARGLSFVIVGAPATYFLMRHQLERLRAEPAEARSTGWRFYLNVTLLISLITGMVAVGQALAALVGITDYEPAGLAWGIVAAAVWAYHWFGPPGRYSPENGLHLAIGAAAGLFSVLSALALLVGGLAQSIYDLFTEAVIAETSVSELIRGAVVVFVVGAPVWWWHWLRPSRREWSTTLWHGYVMVAGALAGVLTVVGAASGVLGATLVWFFGDPDAATPGAHFEFLPAAIAFGAAGAATWAYHLWIHARVRLGRTEPARVYEYIVAAVGLIATASGITVLLVAFFESIGPSPAVGDGGVDTVIAAITALVVGAPLWWIYWSRIAGHRATEPAIEAASPTRRIYTFALFGVVGVIGFISLIVVIFLFLEDLFEGNLGSQTLEDVQVALALVIAAGVVAWYHYGVYTADRDVVVEETVRPKKVLLLSPADSPVGAALEDDQRFTVRRWNPGADAFVTSAADLADGIAAVEDEDVLVVVLPDRCVVAPYRRG